MKENEDYYLVPLEDDPEAWAVRIGSGTFIETVIKFGTVGLNEDQSNLTFNFDIISSPDPNLTTDNLDLQEYAGSILSQIIFSGAESGYVEIEDKDAGKP